MGKMKKGFYEEKTATEKIEKKSTERVLHLSKYLQKKQFNDMQIAAVNATLDKKTKKTEKEWDKEFNRVINKRLR